MLLAVSLVSVIVVGAVGFFNGRDSLRAAAYEQLTSIREMRTAEIQRAIEGIQSAAQLDSRNATAIAASLAFNAGFDELQAEPLDDDLSDAVDAYYDNEFIPQLEEASGVTYDARSLEPNTAAGRYLQSQYTITTDNFDDAIAVDDAGDGSTWTAAHAQYHDYFRGLVEALGYEDVLLLNTDGDVVYTAYKGIDLGVDITAAPYKDGTLDRAYREVMQTNTVDSYATTDFEAYLPSLGDPTAWIVSPVGVDGAISGALAVQVPAAQINDIMTGNGDWKKQGLGDTGEVYLAGADGTMRSISRELIEHPEDYAEKVIANGTSPSIAEKVVAADDTVLLQPVNTESVRAALRGQTGTSMSAGYLGAENLTAYAPLRIEGAQWVIIARIDTAEAFAPVDEFARIIVLSTAGIVLVITLLALLLSQVFIRPLRRLMDAVRRVASGERDVVVETKSRDEFADLGVAFNDMSRSLQVKADLLDEQRAENERLLLTLMPEAVAQRYKQGDETIAEDHQDVTVIYADIIGFDESSAGLASQESLAILNEIVQSFDEAADRLGVERVRTTKQGYLASCGLIVPRVDSARRVVEFALEMDKILARASSSRGTSLSLRAGIDSGTVTSGLVGQSSVVYDMWGDAVNLAYRLQGSGVSSGIFLTQRVVDKLPDSVTYKESGEVETKQGNQRFWLLDSESTSV